MSDWAGGVSVVLITIMLRGFANMTFLVLQDAGEDKEIFTAILNEVS